MPILVAHMSTAGGNDRTIEHAQSAGCDCVQLFGQNNNQSRAQQITDTDANQYRGKMTELGSVRSIAHSRLAIVTRRLIHGPFDGN